MTEGRKGATAQRRNPSPGGTSTDWGRVLKLALISRFLDDTEEQRLVPEKKVLYQFSARGHDVAQLILGRHLTHRHDAVGAYYRAMRARKGPQQANVATAHKLARIVYHLLKYGETYVEQSAATYEEQRRERELRQLARRASKLGFALAPVTEPSAVPAA